MLATATIVCETYVGEPRSLEIKKEPMGDLWMRIFSPGAKTHDADIVVPAIEVIGVLQQLGIIEKSISN